MPAAIECHAWTRVLNEFQTALVDKIKPPEGGLISLERQKYLAPSSISIRTFV